MLAINEPLPPEPLKSPAPGAPPAAPQPGPQPGPPSVPDRDRLRGLLARVLTAAVLIPLAVAVVWVGGRAYSGVIAFMLIILIFEWARIVDRAEFSGGFYALSVTAIGTVFLAAGGQYGGAMVAALAGGAVATLVQWGRQKTKPSPARRGLSLWPMTGGIYLLVPAICALYIRHDPAEGRALTLLLFAAVWATDSGAYLSGTFLGGPKLWPRLSPGKTWTGAIGGVICGAVTAVAVGLIFGVTATVPVLGLIGVALGTAAIIGDLIESALKRAYGVKDTGGAFPGHGGVLDRLDGFIIATIVLALVLVLRQGTLS